MLRLLRPGGCFMLVTYGDPASRLHHLMRPGLDWGVQVGTAPVAAAATHARVWACHSLSCWHVTLLRGPQHCTARLSAPRRAYGGQPGSAATCLLLVGYCAKSKHSPPFPSLPVCLRELRMSKAQTHVPCLSDVLRLGRCPCAHTGLRAEQAQRRGGGRRAEDRAAGAIRRDAAGAVLMPLTRQGMPALAVLQFTGARSTTQGAYACLWLNP